MGPVPPLALPAQTITSPAAAGLTRPRVLHPSPLYDPLALEAITAKEARYLGNIGGIDRPLDEVPLGWGDWALVNVVTAEERG
jgi:hypothetical protein